jgi:hypothetical protein
MLADESDLVDDKLCGRMRCWDETGDLIVTSFFINDKKISKKRYIQAMLQDPSLPQYPELLEEPVKRQGKNSKHKTSQPDQKNEPDTPSHDVVQENEC